MYSLTRQEKSVLAFIALVTLSGIGISYLKKNNSRFQTFLVSNPAQMQSTSSKIDLNQASKEELIGLPGIGPHLADRIIDYRSHSCAFKTVEDIKKVKGIGKAKLRALRDYLTISEDCE